MRKAPSDGESKLWQALRRDQLEGLRFRRQHPIGSFIADFACVEAKLVVEIDGDQHAEAVGYDEARTKKLESLGWRVIRFTSSDAVRDLDAVLATILAYARPSP